MSRIILDCDLMKYRDSGLYHYCLNLGHYVKLLLNREQTDDMMFYVPPSEATTFDRTSTIVEKKWHVRFFRPFLMNCDIWHAPFQTGRLIPLPHRRIKILLTIHDLNVLHEDKPLKDKNESLKKTQRLIHASDAVVCISQHTKNDVLTHLDVGTRPVYVIHNGTHKVEKKINGAPVIKPHKPFIFTMGYVNRKKNFHTLLSLLKNPAYELIIAGRLDEPDYVQHIKVIAEKEGIAERVHITGPVSEHDKAWYFQNCEAFVMPSLAEGFGAPVAEAMRFGKPIFLSSRTSLPEIGGDAAFYFHDFTPSHMQHVLEEGLQKFKSDGYRERVIQRGCEFNWEEKAKEYIAVYRSLNRK